MKILNFRTLRFFLLTGLILLSACSLPGVYKLDIQQGNIITQDMIDQLKPGMTEEQVRYLLGSPMIQDTFNSNRWDYIYYIQLEGKNPKAHRITIYFDNNKQLTSFSGDFIPSGAKIESNNNLENE